MRVIMTSGHSAGTIFVLLAELGLRKAPSGNPEGFGLLGEEGCTFLLPLWPSNRRESGETEVVYYGRQRASILSPSLHPPREVANLAPTLK